MAPQLRNSGAGRSWFEQTIRDQLALGRPDRIAIVFGRRVTKATPGRFATEVISRGVEPAIQAHYKSSKVKQYLKEGRALRTETTVDDTRDFRIGRSVTPANWQALTGIASGVNERLLDAELQAGACAPSAQALEQIVLPTRDDAGRPAPALRFGEPRVMALLAALSCFTNLLAGVTNAGLRGLVAGFLPGYQARQMTYDLRRLRLNGLIERVLGRRRYQITGEGRRMAVFLTKAYARILNPSLAELDPGLPPEITARSPLGRAWRDFERALEGRIADAALTS